MQVRWHASFDGARAQPARPCRAVASDGARSPRNVCVLRPHADVPRRLQFRFSSASSASRRALTGSSGAATGASTGAVSAGVAASAAGVSAVAGASSASDRHHLQLASSGASVHLAFRRPSCRARTRAARSCAVSLSSASASGAGAGAACRCCLGRGAAGSAFRCCGHPMWRGGCALATNLNLDGTAAGATCGARAHLSGVKTAECQPAARQAELFGFAAIVAHHEPFPGSEPLGPANLPPSAHLRKVIHRYHPA